MARPVDRPEHPLKFRHVAPAGAPIRGRDLFAATRAVASGEDQAARLRSAFASRIGMPPVAFVSTGRAALTLILQAMHELRPERNEVVVPSYTCYSVPASVVKAGLRPRVVDVVPETLDYDMSSFERSDLRRTLAVIATNLYGIPNAMPALQDIADRHGLFLVDDAAQALGATFAGRASGTWGDAGLFSLDKGKNISAMDGGVIVAARGDLRLRLEDRGRALPSPGFGTGFVQCLKLAAYATLLAPRAYWIPAAIPQLGLGTTAYSTEFLIQGLGRPWLALAAAALERLDEFNAHRRGVAAALTARLRCFSGLRSITVTEDADPAYLRLPVLARNRQLRDSLVAALERAGIGATASYPASIADVPLVRRLLVGSDRDARGGRHVADRILTLPTHPYVAEADVDTIEATAARLLTARSSARVLAARVH